MNINRFYIAGKIFFLSALFLSANFVFSQKYHFDSYSVKEGLAQSSVYSIQQDKNGFVWMGTASGLSKFNGKDFINYTTENGLAEGAVKSIYIDQSEHIWIGHVDGGISRIVDGKIELVLSMSADITSFEEDAVGNLWVSSFKGGVIKITNPYTLSKDSLKFKQYKGQEGLSDVVFQVYKLIDNTICFVTDVGVKYYNIEKEEFLKFQIEDMPSYFQIICMFESKEGNLWFGSYNGGAYEYSKKESKLKIYDVRDGLAHNWITSFYQDAKNNIWIGTWGGGITKVNPNKSLFSISNENGILDSKIRCLNGDREGNLLIGTKENGLLIFKGEQFLSFGEKEGLLNNQVWAILTDEKNQNWIGTNKGVTVINEFNVIKNYNEENGLAFEEVRYIKEDKTGNIWIGTWGGGVMQYNSNSDRFDMSYRINSFMLQPLITALEVDKSNNLWVGTTDGLVYYEINNQLSNRLTQDNGLAGNDITAIYCDSKNKIWVGARGKGISTIDGVDIQKLDLNIKISPTSIIEDQKGNIWIGTEGKGVIVYNGKKVIAKYGSKDGLLSDYISLLNIDNEGAIWIGTNKGLNKFNPVDQKFYSYNQKMGYVGIESKNNATYKDKDGSLWFGTIKGVVKLNTNKLHDNKLEPLTQITRFRVNLEDRPLIDGTELNYREKSIVFDYGSICLTNPNQVYYQVMLEGADEDWRPLTKQTIETYSPLPPGKYKFKVKASNNNGVWNSEPETFSFKITPPIWQRTWFIIICILLITIIVFSFVKYREKQLIKEKQILEEKVIERTEEVVQKSAEIAQKNKDIIDSITYAKRIQDAILPSNDMFTKELPQTFVLFDPKDIVSGDFYWLATKDSKSLFAAVDCTGHGVPGAFMSIVGYNLLDKIVGEYGITEPAEILNELNKGVEETLRKGVDSHHIKDGMDIALCTFDNQTGILEFSGAYNPLYIISKNNLTTDKGEAIGYNMVDENGLMLFEVKADRFPIGSYSESNKKYNNNSFKLSKGDTLYLFSDGYADQFGGPNGKKFRYKQFKQLLLSINSKPMDEQKEILIDAMSEWKGKMEQVDDIIVIGTKL
ncbi:SpoIIE family protein phosphatase [Vicingus serpentipes]|uniref:SpoIIE family protein phosphatase n=1 Tax=Vicingus serpentipes TaxID=1926625 RepID=A0A5C6RWL4_9FLAO|nr:SpoIIE family protein phosphatase [Vicingus serpentipes]